jgi:histidinol-phosphate/aromatic aminotransferase/cobyric acid decarboxylase-like protein
MPSGGRRGIELNVPLLDLRKQYQKIRREIRREMDRVVDGQMFILGPMVEAFEKELAAYCGVPYAIGVASGTDALVLSLKALGVNPGDRVLTVSYTFLPPEVPSPFWGRDPSLSKSIPIPITWIPITWGMF